jgi:ribonuclease HII
MPRAACHKKAVSRPAAAARPRNCSFEAALRSIGFLGVCGVDEAGRGPLAGPVTAAAVILRPGADIAGINDSKKLTPAKRDALFEAITRNAADFGIAVVDAPDIDRINILRASLLAMKTAVRSLSRRAPDFLLIDGRNTIDSPMPQMALIKGDSRSVSVAAASILAKVARDRIMAQYDEQFPGYGFARHKGYGTAAHLQALERFGPCPIHRKSFAPVARILDPAPEQGGMFDA